MVHEKITNSDFFFSSSHFSVVENLCGKASLGAVSAGPGKIVAPSQPSQDGMQMSTTDAGKGPGLPSLWSALLPLTPEGWVSGHSSLLISHPCWLWTFCAGLFLPGNKPCGISLNVTPQIETVLEQFQPSLVRESTPYSTSILNPG